MITHYWAPYEEKMIEALAKKWDCTTDAAVYMAINFQYDAYYGSGAGSKLFMEWLEEKNEEIYNKT